MKGKLIIALLPVAGIILLVIIILGIICSIFGNQQVVYKAAFTLPFDTTNYKITSEYGMRIDPISKEEKKHNGIDIVPVGTKNIVAIANGKVVVSEYEENGSGEYVVIEHSISGTTYRSSYLHLQENSRVVKVGDQVKQGQQVGLIGSTGYSTGVHLHFSLQTFNAKTKKFEYTDPTLVITNKVASKNYNLYDYNSNKYELPFPSLPDLNDNLMYK